MEASEAPETPTIDALIAEVQALAAHAVETLQENPRVREISMKIEEVEALIEAARAEQPPEEPAPA